MTFHVSMTRKQEVFIKALDGRVLGEILGVSSVSSETQGTVFNCHCPFCHGKRRNHSNQTATPHATANVFEHRNGEGLSFGCRACRKIVYSVHELLCLLGRSDIADWYAQKRYDFDQCCGRGWTCPNPSSVKQELSNKRRCMREKAALKKIQNKRPKPN